ncbi:MAG: NADP-dependent oxidoreductase [Alphaproteobacteria bacterium]
MPETTREIVIAALPKGPLQPEHFDLRVSPIPSPRSGELLIRTVLISLDAANRAWMQGATYRDAIKAGDVMEGGVIGEVVTSTVPQFAAGEIVYGSGKWAEYACISADAVQRQPWDPTSPLPLSNRLSVLGIAGKTAYYGLTKIGHPKAGETVVVSAAAGSVGMLVGQIAKIMGARAVGIAGGPEKCAWLTEELGFDAAVDYKAGTLFKDLRAVCPDGIDVYFDNVGGPILETVLFQMNLFGRIICCGAVSQYDTATPSGPRNVPGLIVVKRLRMEGFIAMDYPEDEATAEADLTRWLTQGSLQVAEDIVEGLKNAPGALIGLLAGENRGKRMIRVAPDPI